MNCFIDYKKAINDEEYEKTYVNIQVKIINIID